MTTALLLGNAATRLLSLGPLDLVIVVLYFATVIGIGVYLKKFARTGEDFFMAGRQMTAWVAGLSFISANLSSLETMGWSAMAYQYGMLGAHAYLIGAIPAILFLAVVMMPFYYISRTHSVPGYLQLRYGEGARSVAGISFTFLTVMVSGASMFAMAKILNLLLGWDIHLSIWVSSVTVAVYVTLGGLLSAVFNEVLQFFLIWLGTLLVPILGLIHAGGWDGMMQAVRRNAPIVHPTVQNADFTSLWRNLGSFDTNPMGIDWFGMVFGLGLAVSFGYWCTDFLQVQRVIVAKDLRSAQNGTLIGAALKMCVPIIVTLPGLLGLAVLYAADGSPLVLVPESDPRARITHYTFNDVLPLLMGQYLGPGLLGLGVTAMIAGFMSGMAGNVTAFATVWTYDVYKPLFRRNADDRHYLAMGRWSSVIGVLVSIAAAYSLLWFSNILDFLQVLVFFFIVPLFGTVILGMLWKRATPAGGFWGFVVAILVSIGMWAYVHTFPEGYRPQPKATLGEGAVVRVEREAGRIRTIAVERRGRRHRQRRGGGRRRDDRLREPARPARLDSREGRGRAGAGPRAGGHPRRVGHDRQVRCRGGRGRARARGDPALRRRLRAVRPGRLQPRPHGVDRPLAQGEADGGEHVQRLVVAGRVRPGHRRSQPLHEAEAGRGAAEPRLRPHSTAGRGALPLVRKAGLLGDGRHRRPRRGQRHLLVRQA